MRKLKYKTMIINTLSFLAPQGVDYLYAACINNDGKYFQELVYVPRKG